MAHATGLFARLMQAVCKLLAGLPSPTLLSDRLARFVLFAFAIRS